MPANRTKNYHSGGNFYYIPSSKAYKKMARKHDIAHERKYRKAQRSGCGKAFLHSLALLHIFFVIYKLLVGLFNLLIFGESRTA